MEPYNLFAQQKQQYYPSSQNQQVQQQAVVPGNTQGATVQDFAAGKQAANSQAQQKKPATTIPAQVASQMESLNPGTFGGGIAGTGKRASIDRPITNMDELAQAMGYTSPQEEDRLRKASIANQRILAVGDALRHIGNIAHTVNYAPSQQFNSPVAEEQARYEKGKALRDRANQQFYTYQQQKAAQDRAAEKMEREFKLKLADDKRKEALNDARISRYNAQNAKDAANQAYWETRARLQEEGWPLDKAIKEARKAQIEAQTRLSTVKANQGGFAPRRSGGGGKGNTYWDYDEEGNIHYYPNKTMWEQGVESHSRGQEQQEEFKTIDGYGEQKVTYKKRPTVSKAGENASNANKKKTQPQQKKIGLKGNSNQGGNGKKIGLKK